VPVAPPNYTVVYVGAAPYYYSGGIYYAPTDKPADVEEYSDESLADEDPDSNYEVVAPPIGATVTELPDEAEGIHAGGELYYHFAGTWYKPFYSGADVVYVVVEEPQGAPDPRPTPGSTVDSLPAGARQTTVDGEDYYVLDDSYYKRFDADGESVYLVVGDPTEADEAEPAPE
jgi:hypothetical protein